MNVDLANGEKRPHPLVGTVVEPYSILDVIAAGGMGVVFKARHMLTDRIVAMKLLPAELARDESNVQRVKLEAKALAQLNHPNIVTTFDFGFTYMQEPFIVMEYVAGESLKEVLDREVLLPVDRALKIFLQAVDAMRYAHSAKILHRDLKPHNIMVSDEPEADHVKILDFGVAKLAEYTQKITRTGEVVGSPLYMSPEQCTGRPTDHRCDIYSIGVMMFETLTGNPPFRGENYISTVHLKCTKLAPNFKDVVPGRVFPERLEMIVLKCLEIEPDKRYANMSELKSDLELVAGVVPKVERPKTSQSLSSISTNSPPAANNRTTPSDSGAQAGSSPGPGEIGWQPSWSGAGISASNMVPDKPRKDEWSDSIVSSVAEPDASWRAPSSPNLSNENWASPELLQGSSPMDQDFASSDENSDWVNTRKSKTKAPDMVADQNSANRPQGSAMSTQDLASLSAALEAESLSKTDSSPSIKPTEVRPRSDEITGDKPIVSDVSGGPVPVPKPNKDQADSHFVLTWDSKNGPAWSATTASPQKPKSPLQNSTGTRLPSQAMAQPTPGQNEAPHAAPPVQSSATPDPLAPPPSSLISSVAEQGWGPPTNSSPSNQIVNLHVSPSVAPPPVTLESPSGPTQSGPALPPGGSAQAWQPPSSTPNTVPSQNQPAINQIPASPPAAGGPPAPQHYQGALPPHQGPIASLPPHLSAMTAPPAPGAPHGMPGMQGAIAPPLPGQPVPPQRNGPPPDPWAESLPPRSRSQEIPPWGTQPTSPPELAPPAQPIWSKTEQTPAERSFSPFPADSLVQSAQADPHASTTAWQPQSQPAPLENEPSEMDWPDEDESTVRVANKPNMRPHETVREEPINAAPPPDFDRNIAEEPAESPIKQLAMRMTNENKEEEAPSSQPFSDGAPEFKNYEPVSLAELNAIKTPSVKSAKPTGDSGLSGVLPVLPAHPTSNAVQPYNKPKTRFPEPEEDTASSITRHASSSALRFNSSRGGNDGKKMVLMSLVGVAIVAILGIAGFMIFQHSSQSAHPQKAVSQGTSEPSESSTEPTSTASSSEDSSKQDRNERVQTGSSDGITDNTTKKLPAPAGPNKTATEKSKKRVVVTKAVKKPKRPKAAPKTATTSSEAPATPRRRRAYSTYDSYYGSD